MALFAIAARRAATTSLPLIRASISRSGISLLRPLVAAAARPMPFSSATGMKPSTDEELLRASKSGIKLAEHRNDHERNDGDGEEDENSASYSDKSLSSSNESSLSADDSSSSPVKNLQDEGKNQMCTVYTVDGSSMKFSFTVYPPPDKKFVINALALRPPRSSWDKEFGEERGDFTASEEVIEFSQLDEDVQRGFYTYLKPYLELMDLGIPVITKVLDEDMMSKGRRLFWEKQLWYFVSK